LGNLVSGYLASKRIIIVGHSFGADVGNLLSNRRSGVTAFVSVEGALTPHDLFISRRAVKTTPLLRGLRNSRKRFTRWEGSPLPSVVTS
jgi:dienelactone hydrolase